jgi:hypothetical protein
MSAVQIGRDGRVEGPLDVHVVSGATLLKSGVPGSYPIDWSTWIWVGGQVRTSDGLEPLSGVNVTLRGAELENPKASTLTNATGSYFLCMNRFPRDVVEARKEGYETASSVAPVNVWDFETTDLLLTRR